MYEVEMVSTLSKRLSRPEPDTATRNAQLEAFAIHLRLLIDFFYKVRREGDDVLARDFTDGPWRPPAKTSGLETVKRRVNKEVAHLTYHRQKVINAAKTWKHGQLWNDMSLVVDQFLKSASSDLIPDDVRNELEALLPARPIKPDTRAVYSATTR